LIGVANVASTSERTRAARHVAAKRSRSMQRRYGLVGLSVIATRVFGPIARASPSIDVASTTV
jgi:hypothetical protein